MKIKKEFIILGLILFFFLVTRTYKITEIPASLYWDEASIGYNAYSISQNLHDEWGKLLPIHFRAFGEFKLPTYIYSVAILTKIIGTDALAIRLPAVLYSIGTLICVYFLTREILLSKTASLLATFFISVTPWFFIFSRTGYEATAGLMFFTFGVLMFIKSLKNPKIIFLSIFAFILSIYSYTSFRIISPLFLVFELFYIKRNLIKYYLITLVIFAISLIPIFRLFIYDAGFGRAESFALIPGIQQVYDSSGKPRLQITYNRNAGINWWQNIAQVGKNYIANYSLSFLVTSGDTNPRNQLPGRGELYIIDLPLILSGFLFLIRKNYKYGLIVLFLLVTAPVPDAITREAPHALRSMLAVVPLGVLWGEGLDIITRKIKRFRELAILSVLAVSLVFFGKYFSSFVTSYNVISSSDWQYGYKEIYTRYSNDFGKYNKIIISDEYAQPYIFALYYLKYSPVKFHEEVKYNPVNNWGFSTVYAFDKFVFGKPKETDLQNSTLIFAVPKEKFPDVSAKDEIRFLDGSIAFYVYSKP